MPVMIKAGNELMRICLKDARKLEFSSNGGLLWTVKFGGASSVGEFQDLVDNGKEFLATTSKGLCFSTAPGRVWTLRKPK
jgi:hypothetical protein